MHPQYVCMFYVSMFPWTYVYVHKTYSHEQTMSKKHTYIYTFDLSPSGELGPDDCMTFWFMIKQIEQLAVCMNTCFTTSHCRWAKVMCSHKSLLLSCSCYVKSSYHCVYLSAHYPSSHGSLAQCRVSLASFLWASATGMMRSTTSSAWTA
jgi:hypothetical protein